MFLNISNHPSDKWGFEQSSAAEALGEGGIIDIPFPAVDPHIFPIQVRELADELINQVCEYPVDETVVMVQGEMTLTFTVVSRLLSLGYQVVAATTERKVEERVLPDGSVEKTSRFQFVQFRNYLN